MAEWVRLCGMDEAPAEGSVLELEAMGKSFCLARVNGELSALDNWCPHRQGPLGQGWVEGSTVVCPWHAWSFDVCSGLSVFPGNANVAVFPVRAEGDEIVVEMDVPASSGEGSNLEQE